MRWTIRIHPTAMAALYRIERGTAATVSAAIRNLERIPRPLNSQALPDQPNTYSIEPAGHLVVYELREAGRIIHVLFVA